MNSWGVVNIWNIRISLKKAIAICTAIAFFFSIISSDLAWAIAKEPLLTPSGGENPAGPAKFNLSEFVLPSYLGHAENLSMGRSDKTVIHIQDAHCNYAAQLAIGKVINYLNKNYNVDLVNLEGGFGEYDFSLFDDIEDERIKRKVADYFLKEARINGAEFFAINNPDTVTLWGIDSKKWYFKDMDAYRNFLPQKKSVDEGLNTLKTLFAELKKKIYSEKLLEFDKRTEAFNKDKSDFKGYISYLIDMAGKRGISIKDLGNIGLLEKVLSLEEGIDFKEAERERSNLIEELNKRLSKVEREDLVLKVLEFKATTLSQKDFYAYLKKKTDESKIDIDDYPNLSKYIGYIYLYGSIDNKKLFDEIEALEGRVKKSLFQNNGQEKLAFYSKCFNTFDKVLNIQATKRDYDFFKKEAAKIGISGIIRYVKNQCKTLGIECSIDEDALDLKEGLKDISTFYIYANKRDKSFIANTLEKMDESRKKVSLVITGGFHTDKLRQLFKAKGVSYVSIIPNFGSSDAPNKYFERLAGKLSPVEEYFLGLIDRYGTDIRVVTRKPERRENALLATETMCNGLFHARVKAVMRCAVEYVWSFFRNVKINVVNKAGENIASPDEERVLYGEEARAEEEKPAASVLNYIGKVLPRPVREEVLVVGFALLMPNFTAGYILARSIFVLRHLPQGIRAGYTPWKSIAVPVLISLIPGIPLARGISSPLVIFAVGTLVHISLNLLITQAREDRLPSWLLFLKVYRKGVFGDKERLRMLRKMGVGAGAEDTELDDDALEGIIEVVPIRPEEDAKGRFDAGVVDLNTWRQTVVKFVKNKIMVGINRVRPEKKRDPRIPIHLTSLVHVESIVRDGYLDSNEGIYGRGVYVSLVTENRAVDNFYLAKGETFGSVPMVLRIVNLGEPTPAGLHEGMFGGIVGIENIEFYDYRTGNWRPLTEFKEVRKQLDFLTLASGMHQQTALEIYNDLDKSEIKDRLLANSYQAFNDFNYIESLFLAAELDEERATILALAKILEISSVDETAEPIRETFITSAKEAKPVPAARVVGAGRAVSALIIAFIAFNSIFSGAAEAATFSADTVPAALDASGSVAPQLSFAPFIIAGITIGILVLTVIASRALIRARALGRDYHMGTAPFDRGFDLSPPLQVSTAGETVKLLNDLYDYMVTNSRAPGTDTPKYFMHKTIQVFDNNQRVIIVTAEPSAYSDLNNKYGHTVVDDTTDAFGTASAEFISNEQLLPEEERFPDGLEFVGQCNQFGGRWFYAFKLDRASYDRKQFERFLKAMLKYSLEKATKGEINSKVLNYILSASDPIPRKLAFEKTSEFLNISKEIVLDILYNAQRYFEHENMRVPQEIKDWIARTEHSPPGRVYQNVAELEKYLRQLLTQYPEAPVLANLSGKGSRIWQAYNKYLLEKAIENSRDLISDAEGRYFARRYPKWADRKIRQAKGLDAFSEDTPEVARRREGLPRVFFHTWRNRIPLMFSSYEYFGAEKYIPYFLGLKARLDAITEDLNKVGESEAPPEDLAEQCRMLISEMINISMMTEGNIYQGAAVIDTLTDLLLKKGLNVVRINGDYDLLSQTPSIEMGDKIKKVGMDIIKEEFRKIGIVIIRKGAGDEWVGIGVWNEGMGKEIKEAFARVNDRLRNEGNKYEEQKMILAGETWGLRWDDRPVRYDVKVMNEEGKIVTVSGWSPSISGGFDVARTEQDVASLDARAEAGCEYSKTHGRKSVTYYDDIPSEEKSTYKIEVVEPRLFVPDWLLPYTRLAGLANELASPEPSLLVAEPRVPPADTWRPPMGGGLNAEQMGHFIDSCLRRSATKPKGWIPGIVTYAVDLPNMIDVIKDYIKTNYPGDSEDILRQFDAEYKIVTNNILAGASILLKDSSNLTPAQLIEVENRLEHVKALVDYGWPAESVERVEFNEKIVSLANELKLLTEKASLTEFGIPVPVAPEMTETQAHELEAILDDIGNKISPRITMLYYRTKIYTDDELDVMIKPLVDRGQETKLNIAHKRIDYETASSAVAECFNEVDRLLNDMDEKKIAGVGEIRTMLNGLRENLLSLEPVLEVPVPEVTTPAVPTTPIVIPTPAAVMPVPAQPAAAVPAISRERKLNARIRTAQNRINEIFNNVYDAAMSHWNEYNSLPRDNRYTAQQLPKILPILTLTVRDSGAPAVTDNGIARVSLSFIENASDADLVFLMAHEADHYWRGGVYKSSLFKNMEQKGPEYKRELERDLQNREYLADEGAAFLMAWAGLNPLRAKKVLQDVQDFDYDMGPEEVRFEEIVPEGLKTEPDISERIARIDEIVERVVRLTNIGEIKYEPVIIENKADLDNLLLNIDQLADGSMDSLGRGDAHRVFFVEVKEETESSYFSKLRLFERRLGREYKFANISVHLVSNKKELALELENAKADFDKPDVEVYGVSFIQNPEMMKMMELFAEKYEKKDKRGILHIRTVYPDNGHFHMTGLLSIGMRMIDYSFLNPTDENKQFLIDLINAYTQLKYIDAENLELLLKGILMFYLPEIRPKAGVDLEEFHKRDRELAIRL